MPKTAVLEKLQAATIKQALEVTRNIGSTLIHFSTGAYVSVVIPLVMTWKEIDDMLVDGKLVDGMDIIVDHWSAEAEVRNEKSPNGRLC